MAQNLVFRAGPGAFDSIRKHGFAAERIGTIAGASGGAKWLVLSQLDRVIISAILPRLQGPVHLIGTSIGAWRFACYAQADPLAALERFEAAYIHQAYSQRPDRREISAKSRLILQTVLGDKGIDEILGNRLLRTHVMTVRSRHLLASEKPYLLAPGLLAAASLNAISRRSLGLFFERALFFDRRDLPPFYSVTGFPLQRIELSEENLEDCIVATGSIPLVLHGVQDIAGARHGVYRDGGVIDYHLDMPQSDPDRLALYPHFFDRIIPGWFDKKLSWRRPNPVNVDRTILVSPSAAFVARLPRGKIPDRTDFRTYSRDDRVRAWREVVAACEPLADEFNNVIETNQLAARMQPI
ncbi:MAG: patatin-like phospholipase family protein [Gammaproteobacteria bacterium]|nr:patatin-like phospholipase family protein [Gammaproteobacteria bacterium]